MLRSMIAHLRGVIGKGDVGELSVDVNGVGYRVLVPLNAWETLQEGEEGTLWISTYVREDRLDLFGFADKASRTLFEQLIQRPGIGPKMGLELCGAPRSLLIRALHEEDPSVLTAIKGIGRKSAEKIVMELKDVAEKFPSAFAHADSGKQLPAQFDRDAIAALSQLGYTSSDIIHALEKLPKNLNTTEERVTAALRAL